MTDPLAEFPRELSLTKHDGGLRLEFHNAPVLSGGPLKGSEEVLRWLAGTYVQWRREQARGGETR